MITLPYSVRSMGLKNDDSQNDIVVAFDCVVPEPERD